MTTPQKKQLLHYLTINDFNGKPLVYQALQNDDIEFMSKLIEFGFSVNHPFEKQSPLIFEVRSSAMLELLVANGVNIDTNQEFNGAIFHWLHEAPHQKIEKISDLIIKLNKQFFIDYGLDIFKNKVVGACLLHSVLAPNSSEQLYILKTLKKIKSELDKLTEEEKKALQSWFSLLIGANKEIPNKFIETKSEDRQQALEETERLDLLIQLGFDPVSDNTNNWLLKPPKSLIIKNLSIDFRNTHKLKIT